MAEYKNQHFVPRCYLRSFSSDASRKSICVYNIDRKKLFSGAPIKSQCSRNYFYGDDSEEKKFHGFEEMFSEAITEVLTGKIQRLTAEKLRVFAYVQFSRTEAAARHISAGMTALRQALDPEGRATDEVEVWDEKTSLREALGAAATYHKFINDLKWVYVFNDTNIPFVTSDDPAIFTNRYFWQRLQTRKFGVISSGLTITLPLAPHVSVIFYDSSVYSVSDKIGETLRIKSPADAEALNILQYIKASENVYCNNSECCSMIANGVNYVASEREAERFLITEYTGQSTIKKQKRYVTSIDRNVYDGHTHLTSLSTIYPVPHRWFSKIRIRMNPTFYTSGTRVRHVRHPDWLTESGVRRWRFYGN